MHEWSLAEAVVNTALGVMKENGAEKINEMKVCVGELQQIDLELFSSAIDSLSKGTPLDDAKKEICVEEAVLRCLNCKHEWKFKDALKDLRGEDAEAIHFVPELAHSYIRCPKCGSPDFEIVKGRGVWIEYIKVPMKK
ncbi:MAG: hydrogenase nickel incorporation protein HypA [Candidatus Asgardarchaeia archaeon]